MLKLGSSLVRGGASLLTFVKDNLKLYLDFTSNKSDTLKFPSEGSTEFSGSSQYIDCGTGIGTSLGDNYAGSLTVSLWFKADVTNSNDGLFNIGSFSSTQGEFAITIESNILRFKLNAVSWNINHTSFTSTDWNHVACVYSAGNESNSKMYLNGVSVGSASGTFPSASDMDFSGLKTIIGAYYSSGYPFDGKIANVGLWSRELSPEEIQSIMNKSYSQLKGVEKTSLVSWWALDSETASGRTPIEQNAKTETAPQEAENKIVLNNHGTTTYTQILNESDRTFASQGNWVQGSGTFEFGNTDVYSEGALKISSAGWVYLATNGSGFDTALVSGNIYKIQFTWTVVDTSHAQNFWFGIDSSFGNYGLWRRYQFNTDQLPESEQVVTIYHQHDGGNYFYFRNTASSSCEFHIKNISCELVGNNVGISNATTTTSVYGGNAPILPRAVDVAKEGQADAIGNGSASFDGTSDYIDTGTGIGNSLGNNYAGSLTVSMWFKADGTWQEGLFDIGAFNGTDGEFHLRSWGNTLTWYLNGLSWKIDLTSFTSNDWNHIALVYTEGSEANSNMYLNGIAVGSKSGTFPSASDLDFSGLKTIIGARKEVSGTTVFDGQISQVGIWTGALTQAQIQSVMESTSYSKIPADVKSTLGTERVLNSDFSDGENLWTLNNANVVNEVLEIDEGAFSYYAQQSVDGGGSAYRQFESGYLMKLEIVVDEYTSGGTIIYATGNNIGTFSSAGTHTIYYKPSSNEYLRLRSDGGGFEGKISSVSIKRVTHDLVAYYPLDGDSSDTSNGAGITNDVTTGEVLGSEILTTNVNTDWSAYGSNDVDNVTDGVKITHDDNAGGAARTIAGSSGKLYKVVFNAYYSGGTAPNVKVWTGAVNSGTQALTTSSTQHIIYFVNAGTSSLYFDSVNGSQEIFITNLSAKEVTSNTGVLK